MKTLVNIFCLTLTLLALFVRSNSNETNSTEPQFETEIIGYDKDVFKTLDELELELLTDKLALLKERLTYL